MSAEENISLVLRWVEEVFNQGDISVLEEIYAPNYVAHTPAIPHVQGIEALKQLVLVYRQAFPDLHLTVEELVNEEDSVVARWTLQGTHHGLLLNIPPTGKRITMSGITLHHLADGKFRESWYSSDDLGLLQQLGVFPATEQTL